MKSTIKVRQHRSAARPLPQAKTSRNHKPENVRIVINDEDGKPFADFEIPKEFHAAMQRDAQAKGISMMQWIEDATREAIQNHKSETVKLPPPANGAAQIAMETELALRDLERVGNSAVALVMMNAFEIQKSSQDNRGWEALAAPGFSNGSPELARTICISFDSVLKDLKISAAKAIEMLRTRIIPLSSRGGAVFDVMPWCKMENCVRAFRHCIGLQDWALSDCNKAEVGGLSVIMDGELKTSDRAVEVLFVKLNNALKEITAAPAEVAS